MRRSLLRRTLLLGTGLALRPAVRCLLRGGRKCDVGGAVAVAAAAVAAAVVVVGDAGEDCGERVEMN